jgi:hypothetical protein
MGKTFDFEKIFMDQKVFLTHKKQFFENQKFYPTAGPTLLNL